MKLHNNEIMVHTTYQYIGLRYAHAMFYSTYGSGGCIFMYESLMHNVHLGTHDSMKAVKVGNVSYLIYRSSLGQSYFVNQYTKESQWDRPTQPAQKPNEDERVQASHLLVKHRDSRRPSSWREDTITRTKEEALEILKGRFG